MERLYVYTSSIELQTIIQLNNCVYPVHSGNLYQDQLYYVAVSLRTVRKMNEI